MGQNNNVIERSMDGRLNNLKNNTYCAKCLKELDSEDSDVVRDVEGNFFCDRFCLNDYWMENRREIDDRLREWKYSDR